MPGTARGSADPTTLDMTWVLREAFQRIDIHNIEAAAARTKSKPFSEYIWHGELFPLMKAIVCGGRAIYLWFDT